MGLVRTVSAWSATEYKVAVWFAVVMLACLLRECTCFTLVADSPYQHIKRNERYMLMCQADVPLAGCQMKNLMSNRVYDLSEGIRSPFYWGTGLNTGQCGFTARDDGTLGYYPYSCRVRDHFGQWQYATMMVNKPGDVVDGILPVLTSASKLVVDAGEEVTMTFSAGEPLAMCKSKWPGQPHWVYSRYNRSDTVSALELAEGRCQLTLYDLMSSQSGIITSQIRSVLTNYKRREFIHLTTLVVKQAPSAPVLTLSEANGVYNEGDVVVASCEVGLARPVAQITWLLDDDVIPGEVEDLSSWPWDFEAGKATQKLSRKLLMADNGKELVCRVSHIALPGGFVDVRTRITVRRPLAVAATNCGLRQVSTGYRISNGEDAIIGEFPWHVGVYVTEGHKQDEHICGGSLISSSFVVSAAHCFWEEGLSKLKSPSLYKVAAGKHLRAWGPREPTCQIRDVAEILVTSRYQGHSSNYQHDIAVVRLASPVTWTKYVSPVCLDWSNPGVEVTSGVDGTVAGWGVTHNGTLAATLQSVDLPIVDHEVCLKALAENMRSKITGDKFCAGFVGQSRSVCGGDSGGGLVTATGTRYFLRGVVSVSFKPAHHQIAHSCFSQLFTGFTDVGRHLGWIKSVVTP